MSSAAIVAASGDSSLAGWSITPGGILQEKTTSTNTWAFGTVTAPANVWLTVQVTVQVDAQSFTLDKQTGETNNWQKVIDIHPAASSISSEVWAIKTSVAWSHNLTATWTTASLVKILGWGYLSGGPASALSARGLSLPKVTTAGATSYTLTGSEQPQVGDLVLAAMTCNSAQNPTTDTDTTNGVWVSLAMGGTSGSSAGTNRRSNLIAKVVTATGDQTVNPAVFAGATFVSPVSLLAA